MFRAASKMGEVVQTLQDLEEASRVNSKTRTEAQKRFQKQQKNYKPTGIAPDEERIKTFKKNVHEDSHGKYYYDDDNNRHRLNGPAVERVDGDDDYWYHGTPVNTLGDVQWLYLIDTP